MREIRSGSNKTFLNKITHGDAYKLITKVQDKSIDLILIDPPYKLGKAGKISKGAQSTEIGANNLLKELENKGLNKGVDMRI